MSHTTGSNHSIRLPYNGKITVGRAEDNDIRVTYPFISRHHFQILTEAGAVYAEDLKSKNGLYLNGKPISSASLKSGDVLSVLNFRFVLENGMLYFENIGNAVRITERVYEMEKTSEPEMTMPHSGEKITADKNAWRIAYADELLKKSEEYKCSVFRVKTDSAFGIYLDTEMIHVRVWMNEESRPVLSIPAYYILDDMGDVLTGNRAVVHAKMKKEKKLHSVLAFMLEADRLVDSAKESCAIQYGIALMMELKRELERTGFALIEKCVAAISVPEIVTQKNIKTAMEKAGFRVLQIMSAAEACALTKAYFMSDEQEFLVRVIANHERQSLKAEYGEDVLEEVEYTFGEKMPEMTSGMECYYFSDASSRKELEMEADGYEELSETAANGSVLQGVKLTEGSDMLMLRLFPWKAGIEITTINEGKECIPLTWISREQATIPTKTECFDISLDSGIEGKRLNMYLETDGSRRKVRTWKMEEICSGFSKDTSQMKVWIDVGSRGEDFALILQAEEKKAAIDLDQYQEEKLQRFPITTLFVPEQIVKNIRYVGTEFCQCAENLEEANADFAIGQGIRMIAGQTKEVLADCQCGDADIRVGTFIEKLLAVKDNVEYGIAGIERTTKCIEYTREKNLLSDFRKALEQALYQLNVMPIEANGALFDPHIHEAVHVKETELVEEDRVVDEVQKGYFFGEKLYRPTRVVVSKKTC